MSYEVDKALFRELAEQEPADICSRSLCSHDEGKRRFTVSIWGDEYVVHPHEARIDRLSSNRPDPHEYFSVFIVNYLMQVKDRELCGEWISEKDIPGGATFFRGPHEIPTELISSRFHNDSAAFRRVCEQLSGVALEMADAAYVFSITSRIALAVLYWEGDDEFPPEAKLLFDRSISGSLALDTIFALAVDVCSRISRA